MAELLVKATDSNVPAGPGKWLQGHVVVVMPDGHSWGAAEGLPNFVVVKCPTVDPADVTDFLASHLDADGHTLLARRRFHFDKSLLTANLRNQLASIGSITLTRAQVKAVKAAIT